MITLIRCSSGSHVFFARSLSWLNDSESYVSAFVFVSVFRLSFVVNGMGVDATQSIPVIIGGSVLFGAVLGMVLLSETLMLHGWSGVGMLVFGIALVATDPGDKATEGGGGGDDEAPPIYIWIGPALICASAYAFYNIFIKLGSASINPILGGVILQFVAAIFGTILLTLLSVYEGGTDYLNWDMTGLLWSCFAGLAVGTAEMLSFVVSGLGVPATLSIPVIIGGSTFFGALLGLVIPTHIAQIILQFLYLEQIQNSLGFQYSVLLQ